MARATDSIQKKEAYAAEGVERTRSGQVYSPNADIFEDKENIYLVADMPGVDESSVDIRLEKNVLILNGFVDLPEKGEGDEWFREYPTGDYQRSFTISNAIDRDRISATVRDGVLRLVLPKAESLKPRQITVTSG